MAKHAMLSASRSERWLTCTPSAREELKVDEVESVFADEGTLAHNLAEYVIKEKAYGVDLSHFIKPLQENELYDESMMGYIDEYAQFIVDKVREAPEGTILIQEQRIHFDEFVPGGFGTVDNLIIGDGIFEVIDLKYGKGVPVDAYENKQLMLYGLGALLDYDLLYNIETIKLTVYQPRINNTSSYEVTKANLLRWAREVLRPTALKAYAGEGEFIPGEHCKFCRVKPTCLAHARFNLALARREFEVTQLEDPQIVKIFLYSDMIKNWLTSLEKYVLSESIKGRQFPGLKLVQGRSQRKYTNEEAIIKGLEEAGYDTDALYKKKLIGITEMGKKIKKTDFDAIIAPNLFKPPGAPTVVTLDDKRPAFDANADAAGDFIEYEEV